MRVLLKDISHLDKNLQFLLDLDSLNTRIAEAEAEGNSKAKLSFKQPPESSVTLRRAGADVFLHGQVSGHASSLCARCGELTDVQLSTKFELVLKPKPAKETTDYEDLSFGYYQEDEIICEPIAQEYLLLSIPYQLLCSNDCKGLCANCGVNLNITPCNCSDKTTPDERFKALWDLKIN